jgi:hypothetical protein
MSSTGRKRLAVEATGEETWAGGGELGRERSFVKDYGETVGEGVTAEAG